MLSKFKGRTRNRDVLSPESIANDNPEPARKKSFIRRVFSNYIDNLPIVLATFAVADLLYFLSDNGPREYYLFASSVILLMIALPLDAVRKLVPLPEREGRHAWVALALAGFAILQISSAVKETREMEISRFQAALVEETAKAILPGLSKTFEHSDLAKDPKARHSGNGWELTADHLDSYSIIGIRFSAKGRCRVLMEKARPYTSTLSTITLNETTFAAWPSAGSITEHCGDRVIMRFEKNPTRI